MSPTIEDYRFGRIRIDGQEYTKDVILFPDHVQPNWWRENGHSLVMEDLDTVLERQPKLLIVGRGAHGRMNIPEETLQVLRQRGIEVQAAETDRAVELYRKKSGVNVVAALHLTC